jgi:hypothetical protein
MGENQVLTMEVRTNEQPIFKLAPPMKMQRFDSTSVERYGAAAAGSLRLADSGTVPNWQDRLTDGRPAPLEIKIAPPQTQSLTSSEAREGNELPAR